MAPKPQPDLRSESNNLNALRAIAVLCVFISHTFQYLTPMQKFAVNLGHAGVLLFFVHTSLVLMMSLERQGDYALWARFMVRRIFRVYPLAIIAVLVYTGLGIPSIRGQLLLLRPPVSFTTVGANLGLVQNLFQVESVPGVLWSLPFEMQMYLVLPAAFLISRGKNKTDVAAMWIVAVAGSLLVMALAPKSIAEIFQYVPCFLAGVVAYQLPRRSTIPGWLFPILVLSAAALYMPTSPRFVLSQWPLCFALGWAIPAFAELQTNTMTKAAGMIANYSFGIYLFHEAFLIALLPRLGWTGVIPAFALTLGASFIAFRFVESPFIELGRNLSSARTNMRLWEIPIK